MKLLKAKPLGKAFCGASLNLQGWYQQNYLGVAVDDPMISSGDNTNHPRRTDESGRNSR